MLLQECWIGGSTESLRLSQNRGPETNGEMEEWLSDTKMFIMAILVQIYQTTSTP